MYQPLAAALDRIFADPLMAAKNGPGGYWDGAELRTERLATAMGTWGRGESTLARLALDLAEYVDDAHEPLTMVTLCNGLDDTRVRTVLEAMALYARWTLPGQRLAVTP